VYWDLIKVIKESVLPKVTHKLALDMCVALGSSAWLFLAYIWPLYCVLNKHRLKSNLVQSKFLLRIISNLIEDCQLMHYYDV